MKPVKSFLLFTAYYVLQCYQTDGAKILSISFLQTKSHKIVWEPLLHKLAERGHQVTVVSPIKSDKNMANLRNIHTIDPEELNKGMNLPNLFEVRAHPIFILFGWLLNPFLIMGSKADLICRKSYELPIVQEVIQEKYDLILFFSFFNECLFGAIHKMNTSTIILSGIVSPFWLADSFGSPSPPSFVPLPFLGFSDRMSFMERAQNFLNIIFHWLSMTFIYYPKVTSLYREILGDESIPSVKEIEGKANLLFSNSHISFESPRPVMPDIVDVGGLALKKAKALPKDLEDFLSVSGDDGFIYFSMGSALKGSEMPEKYRQVFLKTFAKLKQQVLWKWETEHMEDLTKNVKLSKWLTIIELPQQDILGHNKLRLFITHGGHGSTQESIFHGVPLVAIPMLADQTYNMETAKRLGFAVKLEFSELSEEILSDAINQVLKESSYKQRAKELSALFHDQPETPLDRAVYWAEYIIRHKGAPHLRSAARDLNFFQYNSLDVVAFIILVVLVIGWINFVVARALLRKCCGVKKTNDAAHGCRYLLLEFGQLTGLGKTGKDENSHHLQGMTVVNFHCSRLARVGSFNQEFQICAGPAYFSEAICVGDSGGGIYLELTGANDVKLYFIHGILSTGFNGLENLRDCFQTAVFTKVFAFAPWIKNLIKEEPKVITKPEPEPTIITKLEPDLSSSIPFVLVSFVPIPYMVRNVGSNLCFDISTRLTYKSNFSLVKCNADLNLDRDQDGSTQIRTMEALRRPALLLMETKTSLVLIGAAFEEKLEEDTMGQKGLTCAWAGLATAQSILVQTDVCEDYHNPWHRFDLVWGDDDKSKFLIRHRMTERCLKPEGVKEGSPGVAYLRCDSTDPSFLWEREVWPISDIFVKALSQIERSATLWR